MSSSDGTDGRQAAGAVAATCPECGAPCADGLTCWEQLGAILDQNPEYPEAEERYLQLKTTALKANGTKQ